jgi:hypothetical protein
LIKRVIGSRSPREAERKTKLRAEKNCLHSSKLVFFYLVRLLVYNFSSCPDSQPQREKEKRALVKCHSHLYLFCIPLSSSFAPLYPAAAAATYSSFLPLSSPPLLRLSDHLVSFLAALTLPTYDLRPSDNSILQHVSLKHIFRRMRRD